MWWEPADLQRSSSSLWVGRDWEAGQHASGSRTTGGAWEAEAGLQQERPAHVQLEVGGLFFNILLYTTLKQSQKLQC